MPKILNIDYNDYQRKFISIEILPGETCKTIPFESGTALRFYPTDKNGLTHNIEMNRRYFSTGLTGQPIGYGMTWAVGAGSGSAMGWRLGHDYETALNACRAYCAIIESNELVASVYLNMNDNMEAYIADKPLPKFKIKFADQIIELPDVIAARTWFYFIGGTEQNKKEIDETGSTIIDTLPLEIIDNNKLFFSN